MSVSVDQKNEAINATANKLGQRIQKEILRYEDMGNDLQTIANLHNNIIEDYKAKIQALEQENKALKDQLTQLKK